MRYKRFKQCERNGCLYHASLNQPNGCDYCLLTGQPRGCPTGTACDKYNGYHQNANKQSEMPCLTYKAVQAMEL